MVLAKQSRDKFKFIPNVRIEDAFMIAESVIEFNMLVWFVILDLRKAFDRVDYSTLFEALRNCGLPDGYIALFIKKNVEFQIAAFVLEIYTSASRIRVTLMLF